MSPRNKCEVLTSPNWCLGVLREKGRKRKTPWPLVKILIDIPKKDPESRFSDESPAPGEAWGHLEHLLDRPACLSATVALMLSPPVHFGLNSQEYISGWNHSFQPINMPICIQVNHKGCFNDSETWEISTKDHGMMTTNYISCFLFLWNLIIFPETKPPAIRFRFGDGYMVGVDFLFSNLQHLLKITPWLLYFFLLKIRNGSKMIEEKYAGLTIIFFREKNKTKQNEILLL